MCEHRSAGRGARILGLAASRLELLGSAAEAYADMCLGGGAGDAWEVKGVAAGGRAEEGEQELRRRA